jgi:hypothetical protein
MIYTAMVLLHTAAGIPRRWPKRKLIPGKNPASPAKANLIPTRILAILSYAIDSWQLNQLARHGLR